MFPTAINTLRNEGDPQAILHHRIQDRNPHTESDRAGLESLGAFGISTHTLHTEGDSKSAQKRDALLFKSNSPAGELTGGRAWTRGSPLLQAVFAG